MELRIDRIEIGIEKYNRIMHWVNETDVAEDSDFQRFYNGFYRMRQRPASFYASYYRFMEDNKSNAELTFENVLSHLYQETGAVHASFSSKLLATIRPDMPVWDKFVLQNLGLRAPYTYEKDRLAKTIALYQRICDWYATEAATKQLTIFNAHFPNVDITDVKKIDFILWASR